MEDLIRQFGIDARILIAQIINFLVLFFLLRQFAYRPLLGLMQKRKEDNQAERVAISLVIPSLEILAFLKAQKIDLPN